MNQNEMNLKLIQNEKDEIQKKLSDKDRVIVNLKSYHQKKTYKNQHMKIHLQLINLMKQ